MSTAATIHREMAEAWNARDFDRMRTLMHPEYRYTGPDGKELAGPEEGIRIARMYASAFPDATLEVLRTFTNRNIAVSEMAGRGTHGGELMGIPPTQRRAEISICNVMELRDGKIYREREYFDMMSMLSQLGVTTVPGRVAGA